ncbi:MAG: 1-deoxy-D-xylulose-5-phosphate synthase [Verrucomicrobiae bacterium]|nr:1-deoxy-D-xylulose-5-phosphate synthase [Verrucomicrobiae bacterium]
MTRYLDMVNSPDQLRKLTLEQLEVLAAEIRQELITVLARNGGHLGPNLGVVELTLALHRVFETPRDKLVWDVSHQCYVHKLLTGRRDRFHTIRTTGGLSGFASRAESEHDAYGAGHAGTAISAALGMCVARDRRGSGEHIVCIFGDAALTNGISFEALNNISHTTRRFIGVLNDNAWSIAKNVGAIASYLHRLITHPRYTRLQKDFERWIRRMPKGELALKLRHKAEEALKSAVSEAALQRGDQLWTEDGRGGYGSSLIFEELGLRYLGPIDGHNLPLLISSLTYAKEAEEPVVLHVITQKGKGYEAACRQPERYHGVGPYDIKTGELLSAGPGAPPTYQEVLGKTLVKLCERDTRLVAITAAMPSGTGLNFLQQAMPDRYYDVGIAEEHAVIFAAGLATMGVRPVVAIYSTFLQRAYDCIVHDVALQDLPVIFCVDRAGLSANDGPTHHGLYDISFLRSVPNVILAAPKDEDEFVDMLYTATQVSHPFFIRYPRGAAEGVQIKPDPVVMEVGKAEVQEHFEHKSGPKVALFPLGNMHSLAREVGGQLKAHGCNVALINPRFVKPLDTPTHEFFGRASDVVVTFEDNTILGGYGSAVLELFSDRGITTPVVRVGWPDKFIEHASTVEDLRVKYGLTPDKVVRQVKAVLSARTAFQKTVHREEGVVLHIRA